MGEWFARFRLEKIRTPHMEIAWPDVEHTTGSALMACRVSYALPCKRYGAWCPCSIREPSWPVSKVIKVLNARYYPESGH